MLLTQPPLSSLTGHTSIHTAVKLVLVVAVMKRPCLSLSPSSQHHESLQVSDNSHSVKGTYNTLAQREIGAIAVSVHTIHSQ